MMDQSDDRPDGGDDPATGRRWHDMGGWSDRLDAPGIDRDQHDFALWEKRVDALMVLATSKGLFTVDGLRRVLEDMGESAFASMSYYERWISAVAQNLMEAEVFSAEELRGKISQIRERGATYGEVSAGDVAAPLDARGDVGGDAP